MKSLGHTLPGSKTPTASYLPDFAAASVDDIDFKKLESIGVKHLLFDLDQTLRRPYSRKLHPSVVTILTAVNTSKKFKSLNIVSNNQRNLKRYSEPVNARVFQPFRRGVRLIRKPHPLFFEHVLDDLNTQPEKTVMIGDRLRADVLGGNRMGMYTIYIKKRGAIDYWFDWLMFTRLRESRQFKDAVKQARLSRRTKHKK